MGDLQDSDIGTRNEETEKEPCDDHEEWSPRCEYCRGLSDGTRKTTTPTPASTPKSELVEELRDRAQTAREEAQTHDETDRREFMLGVAAGLDEAADELEDWNV